MRKITTIIIILLLLSLTGCEDKKSSDNAIPIENTTEVFSSPDKESNTHKRFKLPQAHKEDSSSDGASKLNLSDTFTLHNMHKKSYSVTVSNQKVTFKESTKGIVLVTFFATWCPPCIADIPYMNDLHKKYQKDLLVTGVHIHDSITKEKLKSFIAKHDINYFVSNSTHNNDFASLVAKTLHLPKNFSIPLTIMYVEGKYFTHYEGCVPVEMIEYDIEEALKILK